MRLKFLILILVAVSFLYVKQTLAQDPIGLDGVRVILGTAGRPIGPKRVVFAGSLFATFDSTGNEIKTVPMTKMSLDYSGLKSLCKEKGFIGFDKINSTDEKIICYRDATTAEK